MNRRFSASVFIGGLALAVACSDSSGPGLATCDTPGTDVLLAIGAYLSLDPATDGCANFPANASTTDSAEYLVLAQSLSDVPGTSASFSLRSAGAAAAVTAARLTSSAGSRQATAMAFDHFLRQLSRSRNYQIPAAAPAPAVAGRAAAPALAAAPPVLGSLRTFKVCGDIRCSRSLLKNVGARVKSVGVHIAIYQDTLAPSPGLATTDFDSLRQVFDTRLYPLDTATFGNISDIDNNSVVIVLMTGQVNKIVTKAVCDKTGGFIAGYFYPGDLDPVAAPSFNNGEVFYSIVPDPNSTLSCRHSVQEVMDGTPVTFTHEFQHMINFVEHVRVRSGDAEEGWLDEGLSLYAEELGGRSYLPGDQSSFARFAIGDVFSAYQYLLATGGSPLLIPADTGTTEERGASWLFTRFIIDQFGDSLAGKLVQTGLAGGANVTAQTGQPFDVVLSRWGLANWVSDLPGFSAPTELQYNSWHFRTTFADLHTQRPDIFPVAYPLVPPVAVGNAVNLGGKLRAGSGAYLRAVQPPGDPGFRLLLTASAAVVPRLNVIRIR